MTRPVRLLSPFPLGRPSSYLSTLGLLAVLSFAVQLFADPAMRPETRNDDEIALTMNDVIDTATPLPGRTPAPATEQGGTTCSFTGSITATDPVQTGRLFRDGVPDTCAGGAGSCAVQAPTGARHYDSYTFTNTTASTQCATVTLTTGCVGTQFIYAAAYLGSFNPTNLCQNRLAESGDSPNPSITFSFNVPAGATVVIVVHELNPDAGCSSYTLDVSNICPPPPSCSFTGSLAAGDPVQTGRLFRDGVPDTCAAPGTCSVFATTGARRYDAYTFTNTGTTSQCATATLNTTTCVGSQFIFAAAYLGSFNPTNLCQNWIADSGDSPNPSLAFSFNIPAGATVVLVVHELNPDAGCASYTVDVAGCGSTINVQSSVSRKTHGAGGAFDVPLPLSGTPGIESRSGGATRDYTMVVNVSGAGPISVTGNPQAQVTTGSATVGSNGASNGGAVTVSGSTITVPLTNVLNAQRLAVTVNQVSDGTSTRSITIPMSILVGDTNTSGSVSATDIGQVKASSGLAINATNFRLDVNLSGGINASDISLVKSLSGTVLPAVANEALQPTPPD